jgi:hypothetical protein
MRRLIPVIFLVVAFCAYVGQPVSVSANIPQDRLIVRPRKIVLVRSAKLARQFPHRKTATVTYPVISGLSDAAVLRRIRSLFGFKNIFDTSLKEYREDTWLSEFSYTVNYNRNSLFDITFTQDGVAAYPDGQSKHFLINLKNGRVVKASDAFLPHKFGALAALVNQKLQAEIKETTAEAVRTQNLETTESQNIVETLERMKFEPANLDDFSVSAKGLTFLYDAGLPHAIQAFQPDGRYFFSYTELTPYLNPTGPLGQFLR